MKKISILTLLALFAATLTQQGGAWAQGTGAGDDWGQMQTASGAWTHITEGSTTGFELKDNYYYVSENLTFTNVNGGAGQGSGMFVQATKHVRLYIPKGVTLTAVGADADGQSGAGAGILLPSGTTLTILGEGTLVARGGNAANGGNGTPGGDAWKDNEDNPWTWIAGEYIYAGVGGWGGYGGGGAGAGIGTAGGNGGAGGTQVTTSEEEIDYVPQTEAEDDEGEQPDDAPGVEGNPGQPGGSATNEIGTLYIQSTITTYITGGNAGDGGTGGHPGTPLFIGGEVDIANIETYWVSGFPIPVPEMTIESLKACAGGGGGGGGAGGGSAVAIGTGGPGGGGGGSGACGNIVVHNAWIHDNFGHVGAGGGTGGAGSEENGGAPGSSCFIQGEESIFDDVDDIKDGGLGGAAAVASEDKSSDVESATAPQYKVSYWAVGTTPDKTEEYYHVGSSTKITLPSLSGGDHVYKWILSIYGHAAGNTTSHCAAPNGDVYDPGQEVELSNIYGAIEFCAVYVGCEIDCKHPLNSWWNTAWANYVAGKYAVVKLTNRTFYRDGYWNTLTLPFTLDATKLANTCLAGADIRTFKYAAWDATNQRLTINFSETNDGEIEAGKPCLIRWGTPENNPGDVILDPIFTNVTVSIQSQEELEGNNSHEMTSGGLRYEGLIAPFQVPAFTKNAETKALLLGAENKLYKPNGKMWVWATHAYFDAYWIDDIAMANEFEIDLDFNDGETTAIDNAKVDDNLDNKVEGIFNLNGQRLDAPQKGINIINGRKVVIK